MPAAAGGGVRGAGVRARSCWVAARGWRWRREPVSVALRASEHPGRAGRCPGGAVSDRDGVVSVSGGGGEAGMAAPVGAVRVRGGGGLLAVAGVGSPSGGAPWGSGGEGAGYPRVGGPRGGGGFWRGRGAPSGGGGGFGRGGASRGAGGRGAPARAGVVCAGGVSRGVAGAGAPAGAVARDGHGAVAAGGAVRGGGGAADRRRGDRGADRRRGARLSSRRGRVAGAAGDDPGDPVAVAGRGVPRGGRGGAR